MTRKFQFLALTLATLAVGLAGHARAAALAYASVELSSFAVSVSDPGYILTYGPAPRTTGASATWGAVTNSNMVSAAYNAESNVAQQTAGSGPFPDEDTWAKIGITNAARGDARTTGNPLVGATAVANVSHAQGATGYSYGQGVGANANEVGIELTTAGSIGIDFGAFWRYEADTDIANELADLSIYGTFTLVGINGTADPAVPVWNAININQNAQDGGSVAFSFSSQNLSHSWADLPAGEYKLTSALGSTSTITYVPEPGTALLLGTGLLGLLARRRNSRA